MPFYCQQETWLVHEDVHQPQNLDVQVIHATAENRPLPARQQKTGHCR